MVSPTFEQILQRMVRAEMEESIKIVVKQQPQQEEESPVNDLFESMSMYFIGALDVCVVRNSWQKEVDTRQYEMVVFKEDSMCVPEANIDKDIGSYIESSYEPVQDVILEEGMELTLDILDMKSMEYWLFDCHSNVQGLSKFESLKRKS